MSNVIYSVSANKLIKLEGRRGVTTRCNQKRCLVRKENLDFAFTHLCRKQPAEGGFCYLFFNLLTIKSQEECTIKIYILHTNLNVYLNLTGAVRTSVQFTATQRHMTALMITRVPDGAFCKRPTPLSMLPSCLRSKLATLSQTCG